jgi:GT2 family glycosyltransferase
VRPAVVVITRNRAAEVKRTLDHVVALDEADEIVVVDNGSDDGSARTIREHHPQVRLIESARNLGAVARNIGLAAVTAPYVAFCDDDTLWEPGALTRGGELLGRHPSIGIVAARVLVGPDRHEDSVCRGMAESPLATRPELPGPRLLGFMAGAAIVRRAAFVAAGGFHRAVMIGGEERLLACDMNCAGWDIVYCGEVATWHLPSRQRDSAMRRRHLTRNALWFAWLRQPFATATRTTLQHVRAASHDRDVRAGFAESVRGLPWVLRERRVMPPALAAEYELLERSVIDDDAIAARAEVA